jgi:predicted phosphodiesterase
MNPAGNKQGRVGELALEYCKANPQVSSNSLAKRLYTENPLVFKSKDHARKLIRYYRGSDGEHSRANIKIRDCVVEMSEGLGFEIPASYAKPIVPYYIPDSCEKVSVAADFHFPFHSPRAIALWLKRSLSEKADCILLDGDIMDCYQLSRFLKRPDAPTLRQEKDITKRFLQELRKLFPKAKIVFKGGNHDFRLQAYLMGHAMALYGNEEYEQKAILGLYDLGIDYVEPERIIKCGHLNILHGHEYGSGVISPVNPARGAFLRTTDIVMVAHSHRSSNHTEVDLGGKMISCWSMGCMCGLQPEYRPVANKWNHGFAIIERKGADYFSLSNMKIINEKMVVAA